MTKGTHLLRSALLALLALAVISGGSLAAGDLFDDDYSDCPHRTRLRDGQIADLSVNRDSEEEDEVNVAWAATDPATWGLGANAYSTSLVVILDDGTTTQTETLSLGSRSTTFDTVDTGTEVTVQMAIVVDTADGDYLISDILEQSIKQSLTKPAFKAEAIWREEVLAVADDPDTAGTDETVAQVRQELPGGTFYYVGYNANFGNYKATGLVTDPSTPRLRIGLAHSINEDGDDRDDVEFDAYKVRITDEDDDVIPEGDDVSTITSSSYGSNKLVIGTMAAAPTDAQEALKFRNVRISDEEPAIHVAADDTLPFTILAAPDVPGVARVAVQALVADNVYTDPPDEHRDFPIDVFSSDVTYEITAWAINEDDEVISPVASIKVRPLDEISAVTTIDDYLDNDGTGLTSVRLTEFTVFE